MFVEISGCQSQEMQQSQLVQRFGAQGHVLCVWQWKRRLLLGQWWSTDGARRMS